MVLVAALGLPLIAVGVSLGGGTRPQPAVAAPAFSTDDVVDEFVAAIGYGVVSADWMPDGRMLASRLNGDVLLIDPNVVPATVRTYFSIPGVLAEAEIGLLDITVDPDFAANRFFYAYFTVAAGRRIEVARFRFENTGAATLATRTTIWQNPGIAVGGTYHVGGSINIGPDGKLYITTGDQLFGSNSQSLTNVWGKVLRINIDGTVPTDNPFYDGAGINVDEIWAYGLRNAYRASFDPVTGEFWVADVGGNTDATAYEEVDIVEAGKNYGWPNCEGPAGLPKAGPVCPTGVTGSIYAYRHNIGQGCCQNRAIIGGEVYRGGSFPASFRGSYVYADYPTGEFFWLERTSGGVTSGLLKDSSLTGLAQPVWLEVGPADGHIYWLNIGSDGQGQLRRLRYAGGSQRPPVIQTASASPSRGVGPLNVGFTATASDADGDPLTYRWDFGDGSAPSALASPSHVYNAPGVYEANLTVSSGADIVAAPPVKIVVGSPPVATIAPPGGGTNFVAGSSITLSGSATDADDGAVPASRLAWTVVFKHNEHTHPVMTGTGSTITVPIATTGHGYEGSTSYLVTLAATDTDGLTGSVTLELLPRKVALTVSANIATTVDVDGVTHDLPFDIDTLTGFQHTVAVPASVCDGETNWSFASWNTGGARQLDVVVPATDATYQATYEAVGGCGVNAATTTTTSTTNPTITPTTAMVEPPPVVPSALPEEYVGVVPARVLDTRGGEKPGSGSVTPVDVTRVGSAQVPDDAGAVVVNVTGVDATADGFVTVWPCGAERPEASNLNLVAGQTVPNLVVSKIGAEGRICLYSEAGTHLLVDIEGYWP